MVTIWDSSLVLHKTAGCRGSTPREGGRGLGVLRGRRVRDQCSRPNVQGKQSQDVRLVKDVNLRGHLLAQEEAGHLARVPATLSCVFDSLKLMLRETANRLLSGLTPRAWPCYS